MEKESKKRIIRPGFWFFYAGSMVVILAIFCGAMFSTLKDNNDLAARKTELEEEIAYETDRHAELSMEGDYYKSDAYYEKIAREKLGLVMPNEIIFIDQNK